MVWWFAVLIIIGGLFLLLASGLPVAFCFLLINQVGAYLFWGRELGLKQLTLSIFYSVSTFSLLPVPLFILMGELMFHSGVAIRMLDVLDSEYIKLARIKGLPERTVIWKHALRNALIGPLTVAGVLLAGLITGAVITETVFSWPGVGMIMVEGVMARDFPLVQAITMLVASIVLGVNLLVDILYAYVDPQIRYQRM